MTATAATTQLRIRKVNWIYLLAAVALPLLILFLAVRRFWHLPDLEALKQFDFRQLLQWPPVLPFDWPPAADVLIPLVVLVICILWWKLGVWGIYRFFLNRMELDLEQNGFQCDHAVIGRSRALLVDERAGRLAMLSKWNPFHPYEFPATVIDKAWAEDGKRGYGVMQGSKRVSFLFTVGRTNFRVNTFSSNRRWKMDSDYILSALSTADMMVEVLDTLRKGGAQDGDTGVARPQRRRRKSDPKH